MIDTISALTLATLTGLTELTRPAELAPSRVLSALTTLPGSAPGRACVGLALALVVAVSARVARALDWSGVAAAVLCGTACAAAGWGWAITLVGYFVAASLISRAGSARKEERTRSVVAKGGSRDVAQVLANGAIYSAAALASLAFPNPGWAWAGLGALAASSADTWATEIGLLSGARPRDIIKGTFVPAGTSGGVTFAGLWGALLGAAIIGAIGLLAGFPRGATLAAVVSGWAAAAIDSQLGSTIQQRRRCDVCGQDTEMMVHSCGTPTRHLRGIRWVNNDVVNLLATIAGFLLSAVSYVIIAGPPISNARVH